jgi:hypothetical protein
MGTPAEESGGGKLAFIEAGYFDDVHAAAMIHPWPSDIATPNIIAITQLDVTYRGHEAHAAGFPHLGRNAADAMVIAQTAIGLLRQQLLPTDRVHGIVTKGGDAPNIIPALTTARFMVRAQDRERLDVLTGLVRRCFEAGALATGTEVEVAEGTAYANMVHDADLAALYHHNAEQLGRVLDEGPGAPVSTDMGDVSHVVASIHPMIGIDSNGAVNHQREFTEACASPSADRAILDGALGLSWTVIDAAQNQVIRARLMGEAVIREAVTIVEEVEQLDAQADLLEDLAGSVAESDPELAQQIAAAADSLESRADALAAEADSRFEEAQELADEALLDEVTGELESDVEDIVAGIETAPFVVELTDGSVEQMEGGSPAPGIVELAVAAEVLGLTGEPSDVSPGAWEPAGEVITDTGELDADATAEVLADIWGVPEQPAADVFVAAADAEPESSFEGLAAFEPVTEDSSSFEAAGFEPPTEEGLSFEAAAFEPATEDELVEVLAQADEASEGDQFEAPIAAELATDEGSTDTTAPVTTSLGDDHATWERDFLIVVRHADWETEFSGVVATTTLDAEAEAATVPESSFDAVAEGESEGASEGEPIEAVAEAEAATVPDSSFEAAEAAFEDEPFEAVAETEQEAGSESLVAAAAEVEPEAEPFEAVAEAEAETVPESSFEAVAETGQEAGPESLVAAVAEAEAEQDAEPESLVAAVAQAESEGASEDDAFAGVAETDDIWYSGAPDDELPSAELLRDEPVGAAASGDRSVGFVWIPAEDERA